MKKFSLSKTDIIVLLLCSLAMWAFWPKAPPPPTPEQQKQAEEARKAEEAKKLKEGAPKVEGPGAEQPATPEAPKVEEKLIVKSNPAVKTTFSTVGGGIKTAEVLEGPFAGKTPQPLNVFGEGVMGGLGREIGDLDRANWNVKEETDRSIAFEITRKDGLVITKKWTMEEGGDPFKGPGYIWNLDITFKNTGTENYSEEHFYLYTGASSQLHHADQQWVTAVYHANGKSREIHPGDFEESRRLWVLWVTQEKRDVISEHFAKTTWVGVNNQYYSVLINAKDPAAGKLWAKKFKIAFAQGDESIKGEAMHAALGLPPVKLDPGKEQTFSFQVYTGPRSGTLLEKTDAERIDAMFYGMTGALSRLFLWVLNAFNSWTGSFGVAIILLTLAVRIVIWPLHIKATRSMKRMGQLAPMMKEVKEKYKDKPQTPENARKMQMETMGLMREYNVSPLGGCLPLLLQMPIFFGYFGMLQHAVEMRGYSFLWAKDLTLPDTVVTLFGFLPLNPLPLLMTATMYLQMKMTPTPQNTDPNMQLQMKIFKFMPLLFLFFCYSYASALALYWTVQNIVSMGQTQLMKLFPEPKLEKRKLPPLTGGGGGGGGPGGAGGPLAEKPKGPRPPRTGGGKSAFKKK